MEKKIRVSYLQLFRFANYHELLLTLLGIIFTIFGAVGIPIHTLLYGEFTTTMSARAKVIGTSKPTIIMALFGGGEIITNGTAEHIRSAVYKDAGAYGIATLIIALFQIVTITLGIDLINNSALRQINRIRKLFLAAVLRQDMTWYDLNTDDSFAVKVSEDLDKIKDAMAEKMAFAVYYTMYVIYTFVLSLYFGWKLTMIIAGFSPLILISAIVLAMKQKSYIKKELTSFAHAGNHAEEILGSFRTVLAFGGENKEVEEYEKRLQPAAENNIKKGFYSALNGGLMLFITYCGFAVACWYGIHLILEDPSYTPTSLVLILYGVLGSTLNLGLALPHFDALLSAGPSARSIFQVIDRIPPIDSMSKHGSKPNSISGDIDLENVHFKYPARPDVAVLKGINLTVRSGETVALVGPSGCGKSTCLQLIQRLYDPLSGCIRVDGMNIKEYNTACLRSTIGVVGQEPVLFGTSIIENIRYGNPQATESEIILAAKVANCHHFISKLPEGYHTQIGERAAHLSGGQKQRIAIARAIVRNPKILLLDEATSALDPNSEKIVQRALDRASKGRTTLVVSHRLSTVKNVDKIVFIRDGKVVDEGRYSELMKRRGLFYDYVKTSDTTTDDCNVDHTVDDTFAFFGDEVSVKDTESIIYKKDEQKSIEETPEVYSGTLKKLLFMNKSEWCNIFFGCLASACIGTATPVFAIVFGEMYNSLTLIDKSETRRKSIIYAVWYLVIALMNGFGMFFQNYLFHAVGVRLTSLIRVKTLKTMLNQEVAWFDEPKNTTGALCTRLSSDCSAIQNATGSKIGIFCQAFFTIVLGVILSFYISWKLTLVSIVTIPLVLGSVVIESSYSKSSDHNEKEALEGAISIAFEAITNIKTIASLGLESHVVTRYRAEMKNVYIACKKKTRLRGTVFAIGQIVPFLGFSIAIFYGVYLVADRELTYRDVIVISEALVLGAWSLAQSLAYTPNLSGALASAGKILSLFDRKPRYDNPQYFPKSENWIANGDVNFHDVEFRYPTRPTAPVLEGLDLNIHAGKTVALVGPSGCGKSTCVQLLLRYYDPDAGNISLDKKPCTEYPFNRIRSQLGLVSQEPVLFDRTIAENIAYGDNTRDVPMSEIIEAAKTANIHEFVTALPSGYETNLGSRGAQLSGGQKQRIAIARAIVRNPRVLLLDEATSALDSQNEKVVQLALDKARIGRTCITIAHRLSTIQNADLICVIQNGVIAESGSHENLLTLNGIYAQLYYMQQMKSS